jgi:5-methylcytosine-specific restriction endonuclease McrA
MTGAADATSTCARCRAQARISHPPPRLTFPRKRLQTTPPRLTSPRRRPQTMPPGPRFPRKCQPPSPAFPRKRLPVGRRGTRRTPRCHLEDGPAIAPATAQAIACHATMSWMLHDHDGTLVDAGRRHRRATPALRRAVRDRDRGRCQYPGCNSRRTDIHHIVAWAKGGKTRLRDLILLCELCRHRHKLHYADLQVWPLLG